MSLIVITANKLLQNFKNILDLPDTDYWYDVGCCEARGILDRGDKDFWIAILEELLLWSELRMTHLAYILGEGASDIELSLIKKLFLSQNSEVLFCAREALNEFEQI